MEALHLYFEQGGYSVMFSILAVLVISLVLVFEDLTDYGSNTIL